MKLGAPSTRKKNAVESGKTLARASSATKAIGLTE